LAEALAPTGAPVITNRPMNILAVSGGGQYGAYCAGVLVGWTASGQRPEFDVVTGISAGALVACFAMVGPKYDAEMQRVFTTLTGKDLFRYRPALYLIRYKSIASAEPLKEQIDQTVTPEYLCDLQAAHQAGRRLFVGTMNAHSRRLTVWDVGAIACSNRPDRLELVRKILLASSSISPLTPTVPFDVVVDGQKYVEEHCDGGGTSQVFVRFGPSHPRYDASRPGPWLQGSNLYLLAGGKIYADPVGGELSFIAKATGGVSATLYALYRAEANKLYALCAASGMRFHMVAVPQEKKTALKSMDFDPAVMQDLFALGYGQGSGGIPWRTVPPGGLPGEEEEPRAGLEFTTR
jgi:hypothetical protein